MNHNMSYYLPNSANNISKIKRYYLAKFNANDISINDVITALNKRIISIDDIIHALNLAISVNTPDPDSVMIFELK